MGIKTDVQGAILGKVINNLAASQHTTTVLGVALGAVVAADISWSKLLNGDPDQIAKLISSLIVALLGYFTNHKAITQAPPSAPPPPSA